MDTPTCDSCASELEDPAVLMLYDGDLLCSSCWHDAIMVE